MSAQPDARRSNPVHVEWVESIGRITMDGVLWAAVEWSETRQAWCIEEVEGHCLRPPGSHPRQVADKDAAVMLATAMIRDGRMPTHAFDLADPDLWRSNTFASLRARLISYVEHAIAVLEFQSGSRYGSIFLAPRETERRLQRAREILQLLKPEDRR